MKNNFNFLPVYLKLDDKTFQEKIKAAYKMLISCSICPLKCGVNRLEDKTGRCGMGKDPVVFSHNLHFGEEPPLVGYGGSGTIFLSGCSLQCVYCQNYPISALRHGKKINILELSKYILELQKRGAENINFVTPTHFMPQIILAIYLAKSIGLKIPIVYNTSGYETIEALEILDGVVDIYLPDARYGKDDEALIYSKAPGYVLINQKAIYKMFKQVGNPIFDNRGVILRGLIVRHLILPNNFSNSCKVFEFLSSISKDIYVSLMAQYFPTYKALSIEKLSRKITKEEYLEALSCFFKSGLKNGWFQEVEEKF